MNFPTDPVECANDTSWTIRRPNIWACPGRVQVNLAILPADWASEFYCACQKNPETLSSSAVTNPGDPIFPTLGNDVDVRTDAPRYKVFRDGHRRRTDRSAKSGAIILSRSRLAVPSLSRKLSSRPVCGSGTLSRA
jgi:uncharacterized protein YcsI (UPF0317 family)